MPFTPVTSGDPLLLTLDHAQWHVGISATDFRKLTRDGTIPVVRIGGRLFVRRADLEAWVARLVPNAARHGQPIGARASRADRRASAPASEERPAPEARP